ncbi:MAG TPA: TlpA disulfide reductase family protein, partial [Thermoanaerobaculia bacterium]|nr:TlpA disulfide reductase family protein [Thermoanaerobaculia bacterium]
MHDKYATRGFKVVGVSLDETGADAVKQFVSDHKMTYPIVIDPDGRIAGLLSTSVLPTSVIIDRNGKIIWRQLGAIMPNDMASVDAVVEKALGS